MVSLSLPKWHSGNKPAVLSLALDFRISYRWSARDVRIENRDHDVCTAIKATPRTSRRNLSRSTVNNAVGAFADSERIAPQHRADTISSTVALTSSAGVLQVSRVRLPRRQEFL